MTNQVQKRRPVAQRAVEPQKKAGRRRAERTLSRETVIAAALDEIDREGLENFSLRNLAKTLDVYPTAIAWHVSGRNGLLAEVVKLVLAEILPTGFHDSWQAYLRQIFLRYREALRRHPNVAPLIGTQLLANPALDLEFAERLLAALAHAGFSGTRLVAAYNAVMAAVVGFTTQEFAPLPTDETKAWQKMTRERLQSVPSSRYPLLAGNMKLLGNKAFTLRWQNGTESPLDASFDAFVDIVIGGLERYASER